MLYQYDPYLWPDPEPQHTFQGKNENHCLFAFERELGRKLTSKQVMLVHITNLHDLLAVYGMSFYQHVATCIETRLGALGRPKPACVLNGSYVFIDLQACSNAGFYGQDTRYWLNAPVARRDAFERRHLSHSMSIPPSTSTATVFANPQLDCEAPRS